MSQPADKCVAPPQPPPPITATLSSLKTTTAAVQTTPASSVCHLGLLGGVDACGLPLLWGLKNDASALVNKKARFVATVQSGSVEWQLGYRGGRWLLGLRYDYTREIPVMIVVSSLCKSLLFTPQVIGLSSSAFLLNSNFSAAPYFGSIRDQIPPGGEEFPPSGRWQVHTHI